MFVLSLKGFKVVVTFSSFLVRYSIFKKKLINAIFAQESISDQVRLQTEWLAK